MTEPLIELEHVTVTRGDLPVLRDVSLRLNAGEHLAILGPNGCGKSTLLKTLTCELYPVPQPHTRVSLFGRSRWDVSELRRRLGVVSAEPVPRSMLDLPASDAVLTGFFASTRLWPNLVVTPAMRVRGRELLERVGGSYLVQKAVGAMSAGEQRKVMIARALAGSQARQFGFAAETTNASPGQSLEMLLLDEPSNNLDLAAQRDLQAVLRRLAQTGTSILLITHHVADIIPEIDRDLLMKQGQVFREGRRAEVLNSASMSELFGVAVTLTERNGIVDVR